MTPSRPFLISLLKPNTNTAEATPRLDRVPIRDGDHIFATLLFSDTFRLCSQAHHRVTPRASSRPPSDSGQRPGSSRVSGPCAYAASAV